MALTNCTHYEVMSDVGDGIKHGTCKHCRQVRRYDTMAPKEKVRVIKLGRINGAIVLPSPKELPDLSAGEATELEAARKEAAKKEAAASHQPVPPKPQDIRGLNKYYEDNKAAILSDFEKMGEPLMLLRWGITFSGWKVIRARWMPDRFQYPPWYGKKKEKKPTKPKKDGKKKDTTVSKTPPATPETPAEAVETTAAFRATDPEGKSHSLPAFPQFNEEWSDSVKRQWFETYKELKELEVK